MEKKMRTEICLLKYICEENVKENFKKFMEIEALAKQGNSRAQYEIGVMYYIGNNKIKQNRQKAYEWLLKSAKQGFVTAQLSLGIMYEYDQNYQEAIKWYNMAAEQGNEDAQKYLELLKRNMPEVEDRNC